MDLSATSPNATTAFQKILRWFFCALGAASCWWMAFNLYRSWQTPLAVENGHWVSLGLGIMFMEFLLVHSGAMMAAPMSGEMQIEGFSGEVKTKKISRKTSMFIMLVFYAVFGSAIAFGFHSVELLLTFSGILISRWSGLLTDSATARNQQFNRSLLSFLLFLIAVILGLLVKFPAGGLTPQMLERLHAGVGAKQVLAAGTIYFVLSGLVEATGPFWQRSKARHVVLGILAFVVLIVIFGGIGTMIFLPIRAIFFLHR